MSGDREPAQRLPAFLAGGGVMGDRIRRFDWAGTGLGEPSAWPAPLRTVVRMMLTTNHPVFIFWGAALTCLYNDAYSRSLGPEKHPGILGMGGRQAWPEIWDVIGPQIEQVMNGGPATWHENQRVPIVRHGRLDPVFWTYSFGPIDSGGPDGEVGGVLVLCTETTTQVQAAQALADSEARYRALAERLPGGAVFVVDRDFRYVMATGEALAGAGWSSEDLLGRTIFEVLDASTLASHEPHFRRALSGESFEDEHSVGDRYFVSRGMPLHDQEGTVYAVLVVSFDITKRRQTEEQLLAANSRLEGVMAAAEVGVWAWDLNSDRVEHDRNLGRLYGFDDDGPRSPEEHFERIHLEDRARVQEAIDEALRTEHLYVREYRVASADGSMRWLAGRGRVHRGADGQPERLTGLVIDISDLKAMEEALLAADRQKDEFLAILAHELRNPLAPLLNVARVLAADPLPPQQLAWCRDVIGRQVRHMGVLLDDLLDISRVKYGRLQLDMQPLSLESVAQAALEAAMPALTSRRHRFQVKLPAEPILISGDEDRLAQVFSNLLNNAAKYTEAGGDIALEATVVDGEVEIAVRDNGLGIAPDDLQRVFDLFSQVDSAKRQSGGGLGIGLALVRGLVDLHGGRVRVESAGLAQGSSFIVTLPVLPTGSVPDSPPDGLGFAPRAGKKVLIADDNADAADSLAMTLQILGFSVRVARDGSEAVRLYADFQPDIALIDIGMPGLDGYEVATRIRSLPFGKDVVLAAITGWAQDRDRSRSRAAGFDAHLAKPIAPDELLRAVYAAQAARHSSAGERK